MVPLYKLYELGLPQMCAQFEASSSCWLLRVVSCRSSSVAAVTVLDHFLINVLSVEPVRQKDIQLDDFLHLCSKSDAMLN